MEENNSSSKINQDLPDFKKAQQNTLLKKILILAVLGIIIVLIGYAFGIDLSGWAKLLRFLA